MKMTWLDFVPPTALLPALVAAVALNAAGQAPPTLVLTENDNGTNVGASLQQPIDINLQANPSTGYEWYLMSTNGSSVISNGPPVFTPDSQGVGGPGTISMPFLAVSTGETTLGFAYYQPWNPQDVLTNYTVTIDVTENQPSLFMTLSGDSVLITWPMTNSSGFSWRAPPASTPPSGRRSTSSPCPTVPIIS